MVKHIANINNYIVSMDSSGVLSTPGIKPGIIEDATGGTGSLGNYIVADGSGGWSWSSPVQTQSVGEINDLTDALRSDTNYFIGELGGQNVLINTSQVTAYGYNAGIAITSGSSNTLLGSYSGQNITSGVNNTLIGASSGKTLTTQQNNIFIGRESARQATSQYSLYIGVAAGFSSSSTHNIGIGHGAAFDNDGQYNVIIGPPSSSHVDTFTCHQATSSFSGNVVIGEAAMQRTNIIPARNGQSTWTGNHNVVIGKWATLQQTTSSNAIAIGYQAFADSNQIVIGNNSNTEFYLPGLQQNATTGDVLTYDGTKIVLSAPTIGNEIQISSGSFTENSVTTNYNYAYINPTQHARVEWTYTTQLNITKYDASLVVDGGIYIKSSSLSPPVIDPSNPQPLEMDLFVEGNSMFVGNTYIGPNGVLTLYSSIKDASGNTLLDSSGIKFESPLYVLNEGSNPVTYSAGLSGEVLVSQGTGRPPIWQPATGGSSVNEINDLSDGVTVGTSHFIGTSAGANAITGSGSNVGFGYQVMASLTQAVNNTAVGYQALSSNTTSGNNNTAIGYKSLLFTTTGYNNTGLGYGSLQNNTIGIDNTNIGTNSGLGNINGNYNVAVGSYSLQTNQDGQYNVALGVNALRNGTSSSYNIAIGYNALANNIGEETICIGSNSVSDPLYTEIGSCIYIGNEISPSANFVENEIVIGNLGVGNGSHTITLGNVDHTAGLYLPGVQVGASNGDVLTFDGTKINLSTLPANSGTVVEPFSVSSIGGLFTMTSLTGYYTMFHTYIDVEFSRISLYTMSDTSGASGTIVAGVFSNLSFAPNTSLSQASTSFSSVTGVTEIIIDFNTVQLSPHNKYWLGISVQTTSGTLYLAKSALGTTDNYFALSEASTFNGTTLSAPVSPSPSSFNFYYRLHRPSAPGGILSNSTTVPTAVEVAHAEGLNDVSTQNLNSNTVYTQIKFRTSGFYSSSNYTLSTANSNITVLTDGLYSIHFTATTRLENGSDVRTTSSIALFINGVEYINSMVHTYNRIDPQSDNSASYTHVGYYTAGTKFDYRIKLDDGTGPIRVKDNGNHLTVMKLSN